MLDPVVSCGVTFWANAMVGEIDPTYKHPLELAFELIQTLPCVKVPVLVLVFCGKLTAPTGCALATVLLVPLVTFHPFVAVDRSVAIRVYWV